MKRKLSNIGLILVFILGFIILIYPKVSNYYNSLVGSYSIGKYEKEIEKIDEVKVDEILEKGRKYNKELLKKGFSIKTGKSTDENYLNQLKVNEEEVIGFIIIDKINVRLPIYHGTSEPVLQRGVGHLEGTSLPIGGEGMHSVLTGHTGLPSAKLFTDLEKLEKNDLIIIKILGETFTYKVNEKEVVLPEEVENITPVKGKDILTLVTCTPYGVNSHRLLVKSEKTNNIEEEKNIEVIGKKEDIFKYIFIIIILIIGGYFILKKYKKNKKVERRNEDL
ncbi:class C sortase [uncultured Clostridium sp.]|uniref:class C sortase n=1 Tax=uncultured Clostridium sp. TaxID=59620 RepID=UPI002628AA88|nr:class C sortase [uncultured Clostridium sp.]